MRWFTASAILTNGISAVGNWRKPHDITILTGFEMDGFVVRHEVLHDLLGGDPGHLDVRWAQCDLTSVED